MTRQTPLPYLAVGIAGTVGVLLVGVDAPPLARVGRDLARPIVLPMLWRGLDAARRDGTEEEYVARGRTLMHLLPEWVDGHYHLAGQLAFNVSLAQRDPERALDCLLAAVQLLEEAYARDPRRPELLLRAIADFVTVRCDQDPSLLAAFQRRLGNPATLAEQALRRIPRLQHSEFLAAVLFDTVFDGLRKLTPGPGLRRRMRARIATAMRLLPAVRAEIRDSLRTSLTNLDRWARGDDDISIDELETDPNLKKIVRAIRPLCRPPAP